MTQHYVGTKIVVAYSAIKDGVEGYNVTYKDGYVSFCPTKQFEEANIPIGNVGHLPEWMQRLIAEQAVLQNNYRKLIDAIQNGRVPESEVQILTEQYECMVHLYVILQARIDKFMNSLQC